MGLLDALFDQTSYGGQGGGLLDLIRSTQGQQDQYQPSQGLPQPPATFADRFNAMPSAPQPFNPAPRQFDQSNFDPASFAPNQASPIAIGGNYQMPRIGAAPLFAPQDQPPPTAQAAAPAQVNTDISAQSRTPQQPEELPPAFGGTSYLERLNAGGGLIGSMLGDTTQQKNLTAQYHAIRQGLISNGETPQTAASKAMVAVMNPEAAKTILPELFTNKEKYQIIKDDPLTGKEYGFVNDREQTINGKPISAQGTSSSGAGSGQGVADSIAQAKAKGATRDELLQLVPSSYRPYVDAVLQDKALPTNMGRGAARMQIMGLAHAVDGNFNEEMIPTRIKMRSDFSGEGANGKAIGSLNTVQHHIDKLSDDLETVAKFQGNYPTINAIRSYAANKANTNPELRDAVQSLNTDMAAVSHEVGTAYNAGHLSDHDMATWNNLTNSNLPPDQLRRGMADFVALLNGKRDSLNHMYRTTFGEDAPAIDKEANSATTAKVMQRSPDYSGNKSAVPTIQEGATATNPQTGAKITFRNGKWQ